jgi:hypothetical protein
LSQAFEFASFCPEQTGFNDGTGLAVLKSTLDGQPMSRAAIPSDKQLKNRWVSFRILDVYIPDPLKILMDLHSGDILQGKVIDLSDTGTEKEAFLVVEVEGIEQPVIVPAGRILDFV